MVAPYPLPGCSGALALPVATDEVLSLHPLPDRTGDTLLLYGRGATGPFRIASAEIPAGDDAEARKPFPLDEDLMPLLAGRAFGVEERVAIRRHGSALVLDCAAGTRPAGAILTGPWSLPLARARLHWQARGHGTFALAMADASLASRESAIGLGHIESGAGQADLPGAGFAREEWRHFTIACPDNGASIRLAALRLVTQASLPPARATWIWSADMWRHAPRQVLEHAASHGIGTLFVTVPVRHGAVQAPAALASFVRAAGRRGMTVWTVDGDPRMVLPGEQANTIGRVRAYAAYNGSVHADARLAGVQFDVEHYLLPGYEAAAAQLDSRYGTLACALRDAAGAMALDFVIPFWWRPGSVMLDALARCATSVTIMDYRTDPAQIAAFAQPLLDWGVVHARQVRIALEAGPVAAERQRRYVRAQSGELWMVEVGGQRALLLLDAARPNPVGPAYRLGHERILDGSETTFHGREPALLALLPGLERQFSAWTSFAGFALHALPVRR
ncbi:hypothetical protein [Massilia sp. METH4]|uniref:hypothetical protein n=1 Tax=Massilia sp. METH4 TaxID=3123041 RepID=UPI0030CFA3B4